MKQRVFFINLSQKHILKLANFMAASAAVCNALGPQTSIVGEVQRSVKINFWNGIHAIPL